MDGPVGNGTKFMIGGQKVMVTFSGNVGTVDAYWTDKNGHVIPPIPEPETLSLMLIGLVVTGAKAWRRNNRASGDCAQALSIKRSFF